MRYRVALCGFSEFEHRAMHFSFQHPATPHESTFDIVDALADADFAVVDADSKPAVKGLLLSGRLDRAVFIGAEAPNGALCHLRRPIDPNRILRTLDMLISRQAVPVQAPMPRVEPSGWHDIPTLDAVVPEADVEADTTRPDELAETQESVLPRDEPAASDRPAPDARTSRVSRAAARAAVRRVRLAQDQGAAAAVEPLRDVLVLDPDAAASAELATLVQRFGFVPTLTSTIPGAEEHLAVRAFAAMFLDIALDGPGLALLERIRAMAAPPGFSEPAVLLVRAPLEPAERVRAMLAGVGEPLIKPVTRGSVARALESLGVAFPADARRR